MRRSGRHHAWLRLALTMLALLVVYYAAPFSALGSIQRAATSLGFTAVGVVALGWAITAEVRRQLAGVSSTRIPGLFMLLGLVVFVFALGYYLLESTAPGQMSGLETRTDALYFTLSTLGTVGFGDIHAEGQMARALASVQIVFDVVFVAALAATLTGKVRAGMTGETRP
jgi:voltage-gated potassium channel